MSIIYADNEIQGGRNLYSNGYIPPVEDTIQVEDSIQAVNTPQEDISIKALFDTPKISKNALQKLASIAPVKIVAQAKPAVKVKKTAEPESAIQAIGYGNSEDEALKSAYQNAVEQYVGVLVDSSTIIQNDQLIKNDILTFSNGYIKSYKKLSSKEQMGLWEVKIDAVIKKQNVLEKIKALNIDPIDIKDSEQTYAKLVTQVQSKFDAEDMLVKLVKETTTKESFERYINLSVDSIDLDLDRATRKSVPATINYSVALNWKEYRKITDRFEKLFEYIGGKLVSSNEISEKQIPGYRNGNEYFFKQNKDNDLTIRVLIMRNNKLYFNLWQFPKSFSVIYPFQEEVFDMNSWHSYKNEEETIEVFKDYSHPFILFMLDGSEQTIWSRKTSDDRYMNHAYNISPIQMEDIFGTIREKGPYDPLMIFPFGFIYDGSYYSGDNLKLLGRLPKILKIDIDIDKLKDLKQVKISWDK